jgi:hypothetical protein
MNIEDISRELLGALDSGGTIHQPEHLDRIRGNCTDLGARL